MQSSELLSFCQDRMAQAYAEQIWAVALTGGMGGFIIAQAERLGAALKAGIISRGIYISALLALLFIWSRHGIYLYYQAWSRQLMADQPSVWPALSGAEAWLRLAAGWSGVVFYTLVVCGTSYAALRVLARKASGRDDGF